MLQEETTKRKEITHKLAVQLAQYRHKEKKIETISASNDTPPLLENKRPFFNDFNVIEEEAIQTTPHIHLFEGRVFFRSF